MRLKGLVGMGSGRAQAAGRRAKASKMADGVGNQTCEATRIKIGQSVGVREMRVADVRLRNHNVPGWAGTVPALGGVVYELSVSRREGTK